MHGCERSQPPGRLGAGLAEHPPLPPPPFFLPTHAGELWLAIILTMLGIGLVVWLVERWWAAGRAAKLAELPSLQDRVFDAVGRPMQVRGAGRCAAAGCALARAQPLPTAPAAAPHPAALRPVRSQCRC